MYMFVICSGCNNTWDFKIFELSMYAVYVPSGGSFFLTNNCYQIRI